MTAPSSSASIRFELDVIGFMESDYPDKFGIPRQPGLASTAKATLCLIPPFDDPMCVRHLDGFSHVWIQFIFHQSPVQWSPLVRPPRLGGNVRTGVFASRSTHRPNRLGLSLMALERVDTSSGVQLILGGGDLVDGTPVVDIKPYLPWAEAHPDARAGFAPAAPECLPVCFSQSACQALADRDDGEELMALIRDVVSQDPRPAYHTVTPDRRYGLALRDIDVGFQVRRDASGHLIVKVCTIS